jgi:acetyltransferase-like isoleucine patch superfamily enzyme
VRFLTRLLAGPVEEAVRVLLVEHPELLDRPNSLYWHRVHGDPARLHIDPTAVVNDALFNLSSGEVTVERHAFFGHGVSVLTGTHDLTKFGPDRQAAIPRAGRDVRVGEGAWLASHVIVLGPCVIGEHAVVAAGSLVLDDVPACTVVAGRPAKPVRTLDKRGLDA